MRIHSLLRISLQNPFRREVNQTELNMTKTLVSELGQVFTEFAGKPSLLEVLLEV